MSIIAAGSRPTLPIGVALRRGVRPAHDVSILIGAGAAAGRRIGNFAPTARLPPGIAIKRNPGQLHRRMYEQQYPANLVVYFQLNNLWLKLGVAGSDVHSVFGLSGLARRGNRCGLLKISVRSCTRDLGMNTATIEPNSEDRLGKRRRHTRQAAYIDLALHVVGKSQPALMLELSESDACLSCAIEVSKNAKS